MSSRGKTAGGRRNCRDIPIPHPRSRSGGRNWSIWAIFTCWQRKHTHLHSTGELVCKCPDQRLLLINWIIEPKISRCPDVDTENHREHPPRRDRSKHKNVRSRANTPAPAVNPNDPQPPRTTPKSIHGDSDQSLQCLILRSLSKHSTKPTRAHICADLG